jgi:uncharacterized repeat protein (TIGR03803 family)
MRVFQSSNGAERCGIFLLSLNLMLMWLAAPSAHGQIPGITFKALAGFNNGTNGANPYAPPVLGADGNLYGTMPYGGTNGIGVIFKVTTNGFQSTLYTFKTNFNNLGGASPFAPLVSGQDGNLYGVASGGGSNSLGTIFEITTNGAFTLLYSFGMVTNDLGYALDGSTPYTGLIQGRDGFFYGMTYSGGVSNLGTIFQFSTNGTLTPLYSFTGNGANDDGASPVSQPLVEGADGVFYGTTSAGGTNNDGTVFQVTSAGALTILFEFNSTDGKNPYAGLSFGSDGDLYGTTVYGGTNTTIDPNGVGTAFQITTNGVLTTLFEFGGPEALYYPEGGVVPGNDNTLFGTTYYDNAYGSVFQLTTNGLLTKLHSFTNGIDGANPYAGVIRDADGSLFGAALYGGTNGGFGTVFRLNFTTLLTILSPTANEFWSNNVFTVTGTASDNAPGGAITNVLYSPDGATWTNATTANGWINWTADVALARGSNTLQAYAVDGAGNVSATNTVTFVNVTTPPLTVLTNGLGAISPNYNGAFLTFGSNYSMTATASAGFAFTNWTGGTDFPLTSVTNGPTVQFVMETNLVLQANFVDLIKPTISITNVPAGLSVSDMAFTVQGKAGDNWQVTNVFYSLNSGDWSNAMTANNWTNWSADVALIPGTNTIAAYAVDPDGNASPTSNVSLFFVVTNQLQISAIGRGTISPNYSNAWLQIGRNYAITATAASGFVFTNWTISTNWLGGVITNNATVQFMMASNLTLQVTFADVTKPTLSITNVTSGMNVSNAAFVVKGKAGDNVAVSNVFYSLNSGDWSNAMTGNDWTNWSAAVMLLPGTNTIAAYAVDTGGNLSTTNSLNFFYVVNAMLTVSTNGLGTLNPNYSGALLQIGKSYSITATAGTGFAFTNWTGGTNLPLTLITNKTTVQFLMVTNLMLQANFVDVTKPTLTITAPASGQHMSNALATVTGTASDNWKVVAVWYQLTNGILPAGTWSQAVTTNSYTNWSTTLTLAAGTNMVKAYAVDLGGNLSTTNSVSFVSSNSFVLQLVITNPPVLDSGLSFKLQLTPVLNGHIQVSTNLVNWAVLTNFIGTNATINFRDSAATNYSDRFYRAVVP